MLGCALGNQWKHPHRTSSCVGQSSGTASPDSPETVQLLSSHPWHSNRKLTRCGLGLGLGSARVNHSRKLIFTQPKQTPERGTLSQSHKHNANDLERLEEPGQGSWSYFSHSHLIFIACVLFLYVVLLIILKMHFFQLVQIYIRFLFTRVHQNVFLV